MLINRGKFMLKKDNKKLGEILLDYKMISHEDLSRALKMQKEKNKRIGETLIDLKMVTQDQINWILSKQLDIPYVQIEKGQLDMDLLRKFPEYLVKNYNLIPLIEIEGKVVIAMADPTDSEAIDKIKNIVDQKIEIAFASFRNILDILGYIEKEYPSIWQNAKNN